MQLTYSPGELSGTNKAAQFRPIRDRLVEADENLAIYLQTDMVLTDLVGPSSSTVTITSPDSKIFS